ncbi:MAG: Stp1/IreP family PP2C-type Ser/Thr phosphatase [Deltaproteobacteria bacterium]|nr:Stp1/IreP family PP2C-type Ser/Thr phosphatase [Deltaproteobacteria bacterium]
MLQTSFFGKSDTGLKRPNNEDAFIIKLESGFCAVADGMGGAAAGELASSIFIETAAEVFLNYKGRSEKKTVELFQKAFSLSNTKILNHTARNPDHKGMGCTAELLAFSEKGFVIGHVGDSRTYLYRNKELEQLTKDHSLVQEQIDQGLIKPEQAMTHPMRNIILRAVGVKEGVAPDILKGENKSGDLFLLCSDGLTDMVADAAILEVLSLPGTLSHKTDKLIESAKSAGGNDNITVVLSIVHP